MMTTSMTPQAAQDVVESLESRLLRWPAPARDGDAGADDFRGTIAFPEPPDRPPPIEGTATMLELIVIVIAVTAASVTAHVIALRSHHRDGLH